MILSKSDSRALIEKILSMTNADEARVNLSGGRSGNTRFALNAITTSGDEDTFTITLRAAFGSRHASMSVNQTDDASLESLVRKTEEAAKFAPEDPEYVPELGRQNYLSIKPFSRSTARASARSRVKGTEAALRPARRNDLVSAGFLEHDHSFSAVGNSAGLFAHSESTDASFSNTIRTKDGKGSGWAGNSSRDFSKVDCGDASKRAVWKSKHSADANTLEPGIYSVILEPQAVADLMRFAAYAMNARSADEGRSFYSKKGGGNKLGEQVCGTNITIRSQPKHPEILGFPFAGNGLPAKEISWIENGILKNLYYDRYWAYKNNVESTGFPSNMVIEGGTGSVEDLIRGAKKAVLVTRLWYIRFVDPQTILMTGLTRDGTFLVENGKIKHAVKNFRFNESPMTVLNNVENMSKSVRVGGSLVPAMHASQFNFASLSDAV